MVLNGGFDVGMSTNPDTKNRPHFIEICGEKVVCLAKGGECRTYGEFYTVGGLRDSQSWKTPVISKSCPDKCPYKYLVCENHDHSNDDAFVFQPYPEYNKFRGEFSVYCKDFSRINLSDESIPRRCSACRGTGFRQVSSNYGIEHARCFICDGTGIVNR